jgi:hypothetical protein
LPTALNASVQITHPVALNYVQAWGVDSSSPNVTARQVQTTLNANKFSTALPPYSVMHFVLKPDSLNSGRTSPCPQANRSPATAGGFVFAVCVDNQSPASAGCQTWMASAEHENGPKMPQMRCSAQRWRSSAESPALRKW